MTTENKKELEANCLQPSEAIRDAVIYKLATDAQSQFWKRVKSPILIGLSVIGVMLALFGISWSALIPGWIDSQAKKSVQQALEKESKVYSEQAKQMREQTLEQLTETRIAAKKSQEVVESLLLEQRQKLSKELGEQREEIKSLEKETSDFQARLASMQRKANSLQELAEIEDMNQLARKINEISKLASDIGETSLVSINAEIESISKKLTSAIKFQDNFETIQIETHRFTVQNKKDRVVKTINSKDGRLLGAWYTLKKGLSAHKHIDDLYIEKESDRSFAVVTSRPLEGGSFEITVYVAVATKKHVD